MVTNPLVLKSTIQSSSIKTFNTKYNENKKDFKETLYKMYKDIDFTDRLTLNNPLVNTEFILFTKLTYFFKK